MMSDRIHTLPQPIIAETLGKLCHNSWKANKRDSAPERSNRQGRRADVDRTGMGFLQPVILIPIKSYFCNVESWWSFEKEFRLSETGSALSFSTRSS